MLTQLQHHAVGRVALTVVVLMVLSAVVSGAVVAEATAVDEPVSHLPPVDGPVIDRFRPPETPYGPGNRGLKYATRPGDPVRASADGAVTFAGQVGGTLHVTVGHADGVRTSYSFLASVDVGRGQRLHQGDPVGTAGEVLHFGARVGDAYIDPASLLGGPGGQVEPDPLRGRARRDGRRGGAVAAARAGRPQQRRRWPPRRLRRRRPRPRPEHSRRRRRRPLAAPTSGDRGRRRAPAVAPPAHARGRTPARPGRRPGGAVARPGRAGRLRAGAMIR